MTKPSETHQNLGLAMRGLRPSLGVTRTPLYHLGKEVGRIPLGGRING